MSAQNKTDPWQALLEEAEAMDNAVYEFGCLPMEGPFNPPEVDKVIDTANRLRRCIEAVKKHTKALGRTS